MRRVMFLFLLFIGIAHGFDETSFDPPRYKPLGIVGGHRIEIEKASYIASLHVEGDHLCGGSIIHERFILTASHCILSYYKYTIKVGTDNTDLPGQRYAAEKLIRHEKYDTRSMNNDIALIKLKIPIKFGQNVSKINLPSKGHQLKKGDTVLVTGWGDTRSTSEPSNLLRQVGLPVVTNNECKKAYKPYPAREFQITAKVMCAGTPGKDSCQGDSGGPITVGKTVVGVVSRGYDCGVIPGINTKVSSYLNWIKKTIKKNLN